MYGDKFIDVLMMLCYSLDVKIREIGFYCYGSLSVLILLYSNVQTDYRDTSAVTGLGSISKCHSIFNWMLG